MNVCGCAEEERNKLFHSKAVSVISTILLSASDECAPARPFFPIKTVLAAVNHAPNQKDAKMNQDVLWAKARYSNCPQPFCHILKLVHHNKIQLVQSCCANNGGRRKLVCHDDCLSFAPI